MGLGSGDSGTVAELGPGCGGFSDRGGVGSWAQGVLGLWRSWALGAGDSRTVGELGPGRRGFWDCELTGSCQRQQWVQAHLTARSTAGE